MVRNKKSEVIKRRENVKVEAEIGAILEIMEWIKEYTENIDLVKSELKTTLLAMNIDTNILEVKIETETDPKHIAAVKTSFFYQSKRLFGFYINVYSDGKFDITPGQAAAQVRGELFELLAHKVATYAMLSEEDKLKNAFGLETK